MSICVHPLKSQSFLRRDPHPVMGWSDTYECVCGFQSKRLTLNEETLADMDLRTFRKFSYRMYVAALRRGLLVPAETCERCGTTEGIQGHHYDYSRPLEVEWLCQQCHARADMARRAAEAGLPTYKGTFVEAA